jgi:dipeptidyl aminopeptidase/acylaminoacyl peptidase
MMKNWKMWPNVMNHRLWLMVVSITLIAGLIFVPRALAQEGGMPQLTVLAEKLAIRSGPDATYPPFDTLEQGTVRGIIGYSAKTGWWQVVSKYGSPGWVSGDPADVSVNQAAIQQFMALPEPQPVQNVTSPLTAPASGILVFQTISGGPIYAINEDGTNLRYLTTGIDPTLSPDGQQVAFTRWETSQDGALGNVWLINVDGSGERVIHENLYNPRTPVWSADGSELFISMQHGGHTAPIQKCWGDPPPRDAQDVEIERDPEDLSDVQFCFTLPPDPYWGLRRIEVATGAYQDLPGDTYSLSPAVNPLNSQHLVYDGDRALVNLNLETEETWPLIEDPNAHSPVYSPDGSRIALTYRQDEHWEIQVMNADGSARTRLTATSYQSLVEQILTGQSPQSHNNASPAWSPDGSRLAFVTDRTGQHPEGVAWEIWVMNADGSNQQPLFPAGTLDGIPLQYNGMDERMLSWR